jgi:hypothetical protein
MPFGPLVRLKGSERLLRKMRTISPSERHDGEVIPAQLQRRRAEQDPKMARDRGPMGRITHHGR